MRLLIAKDNPSLAEITAELLHCHDGGAQRLEAITLAADLQTAILCLPEHNAVLCDSAFPYTHDSHWVVEEWDVAQQEARPRGIHFVLYCGYLRALDLAR